MIIDQQRNAQTSANRCFLYENQSPNPSHLISQGLYSPTQTLVESHVQVCELHCQEPLMSEHTISENPFQSLAELQCRHLEPPLYCQYRQSG